MSKYLGDKTCAYPDCTEPLSNSQKSRFCQFHRRHDYCKCGAVKGKDKAHCVKCSRATQTNYGTTCAYPGCENRIHLHNNKSGYCRTHCHYRTCVKCGKLFFHRPRHKLLCIDCRPNAKRRIPPAKKPPVKHVWKVTVIEGYRPDWEGIVAQARRSETFIEEHLREDE